MASEADVLSVGDQVWVRTGLTGTHEEPAVVSALGAEGGLHVRYSVSRIVEAVEADRVRSFGGGGPEHPSRRAAPDASPRDTPVAPEGCAF